MIEAKFYESKNGLAFCRLCPHKCVVKNNQTGLCGVRRNFDGKLYAEGYGQLTSLALDPIEKKPLNRFYPGRKILSGGSYGCNMKCRFCQNYSISQCKAKTKFFSPENLVKVALEIPENLGFAFTYNEPLINIEYLLDTMPLLQKNGMKNVLVSNGMINNDALEAILPFIDAINIDLKAFTQSFYKKMGGDLEAVKFAIKKCVGNCHVEITLLVIPGENDDISEITALIEWIAALSSDIPLHISRFFPRHKMQEIPPTPIKTLQIAFEAAKQYLNFVYLGNI